MAAVKTKFFKNYRVYMLTSVAYMGSLLFGMYTASPSSSSTSRLLTRIPSQVMTRV